MKLFHMNATPKLPKVQIGFLIDLLDIEDRSYQDAVPKGVEFISIYECCLSIFVNKLICLLMGKRSFSLRFETKNGT